MNELLHLILKILRKIYAKTLGPRKCYDRGIINPDKASAVIYELLASGKPCMVARFGSVELNAIVNYCGVKAERHSGWRFITGRQPQWWWNRLAMSQMQTNAGFFPVSEESIGRFAELMLEDMKQVDVLGSWRMEEHSFCDRMPKHLIRLSLHLLEPYWSKRPWTRILAGKSVLVIHPFSETIKSQYANSRESLFENKDVLPLFELHTIKAVQSLGGESGFDTWFDALEHMKRQMDAIEYEICMIGCGAYGFPLAAYAKRRGKQAIHLGGALQLLFGIRGNRWEDPAYGVKEWGLPYGFYRDIMNEYWKKPLETEKPQLAEQVEGACYW